jgi:transcriptional repressor NrdR
MKCPYCGEDNDRVSDSRSGDGGDFTRRRRECLSCSRRFTTLERVELALPAFVKRDGRREPFDREKMLRGLRTACAKRPVSTDRLQALVDAVERAAAATGQSEILWSDVGTMVMDRLRELDSIAYIRFASVYRRFEDVESLVAEADRIRSDGRVDEGIAGDS